MTPEDTLKCERNHQAYMQRRADFNKDLVAWFETHSLGRKDVRTIARNNPQLQTKLQ